MGNASKSPIQRLPESVINQIAAGEVVERPASVLKELAENSLDAGASSITFRLWDAGMARIEILDDGHGIPMEELPLAVERHATSKLHQASDLESIESYGFRGEALSSIASVSKLTFETRTANDSHGYRLTVDNGKSLPIEPVAMAPGSLVTVIDLFGQLPARKKFLKTVGTELTHCSRTIRELALANPATRFEFHHQGQLNFAFASENREGRFKDVLKPEWTPLHIMEEQTGLKLEAFLSPTHLLQSRGELSLIINGRCVRNRSLLAAVRSAYQTMLGPNHDPSGVIYIDMAPESVDVNVHPQKLEVRCLKQEAIYSWLFASLKKRLTQSNTIYSVPVVSTPNRISEYQPPPLAHRVFQPPPVQVPLDLLPIPVEGPTSSLRFLGQVDASYLVCEDSEGLLLIDQHALHEKLTFEELRSKVNSSTIATQSLLIPKIIEVPKPLTPILEEHLAQFRALGIEMEDYGHGAWVIKSRPAILEEGRTTDMVIDTLQKIESGYTFEKDELLAKALYPILATIACHSVVRANQTLGYNQSMAIISRLQKEQFGWTCPHGRPVLFRLSFFEIEKHFQRR